MNKSQRWIKKTIAEAEACTTKLPWERGARRADFIARRMDQDGREVKISLPAMPKGISLAASA